MAKKKRVSRIVRKINLLNNQARECRMFNEEAKASQLYEIKVELVKKHGKPIEIHTMNNQDFVVYKIFEGRFHIPAYKVNKEIVKRLKKTKVFENSIKNIY